MPTIFYVLMRRLRTPLILLILIYAIAILGFVLIPGRDNEGNVWHMSFLHAFYFVSYTASTIGFGEIPYAFTDAQRMWTTLTIYISVIGWLYSIGSMLTILQDPAFAKLRRYYLFTRHIKELRSPFYLVCGYGQTGSILVQSLSDLGIKAVVIDRDEMRINELELDAHLRRPIGLAADASRPNVLEDAGVTHPYCRGVIALTDSDSANLMIALSTHLLKPDLRLLARAETDEAVANIRSFGDNEVINPFDTFAGRLEMALSSPSRYVLFEWLAGEPNQILKEPVFPRKGRWVLAGFGRFGRAIYRRLTAIGVEVQVIDQHPAPFGAPADLIKGEGTEAAILRAAGIERATGIIAGTNDDATNLSILMTARELNAKLFMIARQNERENTLVFDKGQFDFIMKRGDVIAHKIFALLRTPLLNDFLNLAEQQSEAWTNELLSRILGVVDDRSPYLWEIRISRSRSPAIYQVLSEKRRVPLGKILCNPRDCSHSLPVLVLMIKRHGELILLPAADFELKVSDRLLLCGTEAMSDTMEWATQNQKVLHYLLTGREAYQSPIGEWLDQQWHKFVAKSP